MTSGPYIKHVVSTLFAETTLKKNSILRVNPLIFPVESVSGRQNEQRKCHVHMDINIGIRAQSDLKAFSEHVHRKILIRLKILFILKDCAGQAVVFQQAATIAGGKQKRRKSKQSFQTNHECAY